MKLATIVAALVLAVTVASPAEAKDSQWPGKHAAHHAAAKDSQWPG